jgi:hypothetical protein
MLNTHIFIVGYNFFLPSFDCVSFMEFPSLPLRRDVALEAEFHTVNTNTEQDEQRDNEVVDINASVGGYPATTTEQGPTPDHAEDQKIADFDADKDAASFKTEDELSMKDDDDQEDAVAASDIQVEESTGVSDNANGAAEDVAEPRDVEDEPESDNLKTAKE